jgi:RNA polymerase sigma-70 factor, ECF subfamily
VPKIVTVRREELEAELPQHLPALKALTRRMIGHAADSEDVLQEALLRASASLGTFRAESSLKTWLFSITTRTAIDHLRARTRWDKQVMVEACDEKNGARMLEKYADPSISFDVRQHLAFCFTCIGRSLEPEAHAALVLKEVFGLESKEAAEVLQTTEPRFRHALSAAREAMRGEYEGLCALVNKNGACYQCRVLREMGPAGREGPELPAFPLPMEKRLELVAGEAKQDGRFNDYFFAAIHAMQAAKR